MAPSDSLDMKLSVDKLARDLEQWVKKMKCSGSSGIGLETFPDIRVGVDPSPVESYQHYTDENHKSDINSEDSIKHCLRTHLCEAKFDNDGDHIENIKGKYNDGKLNGKAKIFFKNKISIDGYFKDGILHGFARYFDKKGRLTFVGNHKNGLPDGTCWRIIRGGGCIVGMVDEYGHLTGDDIAYIYPDFLTALVGTFIDGVMERGQEAEVVGVVEDKAGIKVPLCRKIVDGHVHDRQQRQQFGLDALAKDPYESKMVEVKSSIIEGANEGLFAKKDIEVNTIIAFYNGCQANPDDYDPDSWETNNYKIFDPGCMPHGTIDIPAWAQVSSAYCATLAHKTNHSFLPNSQFVVFDHPKYGLIPCLATIADIQQGEEIRVAYGYEWDEAPDWYKLEWTKSTFCLEGVDYEDWMNCNVKNSLHIKK